MFHRNGTRPGNIYKYPQAQVVCRTYPWKCGPCFCAPLSAILFRRRSFGLTGSVPAEVEAAAVRCLPSSRPHHSPRGRVCSAATLAPALCSPRSAGEFVLPQLSTNLDPRTGSVVAQLQWASRQSSTWSPARPSSPLPWPTSCPDTIVLFLPFLPLPVLMRRALVVARLQAQTGRQERPLPLVVAENSWPQPWSVERCAAASLLPFLSLPVPARPPAPRNPSTHAANTWKDGKLVANPSEWFGKYQGLSPASRDLKN